LAQNDDYLEVTFILFKIMTVATKYMFNK